MISDRVIVLNGLIVGLIMVLLGGGVLLEDVTSIFNLIVGIAFLIAGHLVAFGPMAVVLYVREKHPN